MSGEWSEWLKAHGPTLLLWARQWVNGRADAEDVVQEGFLRFWRSRDQAQDPLAFLYASVRRCALEWIRGGRRRNKREEAWAATQTSEGWFTGLGAEQDERRQAIEAALRQVPEEQREVLVAKIWGKLTFAQIAEALEIPQNTAASRYRYALQALREQLSEDLV